MNKKKKNSNVKPKPEKKVVEKNTSENKKDNNKVSIKKLLDKYGSYLVFAGLSIAILIVGSLAIGLKKTLLVLGAVLVLTIILVVGKKLKVKKKANTKEEKKKDDSKKEDVKKEKTTNKVTHRKLKIFLLIVFILGILCFAAMTVFFYMVIKTANPKYDTKKLYNQESSIIFDRDNNIIAELAFEKREIVTYEELPEVLVNAIIATEDSRFFQHNGFDLLRFTKASIGQVLGKNSGGASTLSMQISKNRFTSTEASGFEGILRKFQDIYLSIFKLERDYTKKEIIEIYANSFYLGGSSYGVEQASQTYFGKSVKDINLAEAALLAGLYQSPASLDPLVNPAGAEKRRQTVLYLMNYHGYITKEEYDIAKTLTVPTLLKNKETEDSKQYLAFINTVIKEVEKRTGLNPYYTSMHIYSTMDAEKQAYLDKLMYTNDVIKWENPKVDAGITVLENGTAEIVAIGGGRNTVALGYNNATDINRQIGSTSKPLYDYGPAIEYNNISTYNLIADEPYTYSSGSTIMNYDKKNVGLISTRNSLRDSRNVPALKTFQSVKLSNIKQFVNNLHLHPESSLHEAHSVGGYNGESPLSLAGAYQAIANGGYYIEPHSVRKIVYLESGDEFNVVTPKEKAMSASTAYMLTDMLITTARKAYGSQINGATVASKTGTTDFSPATIKAHGLSSKAINDLWYAGFNKNYTLTVWYGYSEIDKQYYSKRGNTTHKKIFIAVGKQLFKGNNMMSKPSNVVSVEVEKDSYPAKLPSEFTPSDYRTKELFINGTQPTEVSTRFSRLSNVTNLTGTYANGTVTLAWSPIATPDPLSELFLRSSYERLFTNKEYFEEFILGRLESEKQLLGNLGYRIYLKHDDGTLESVDYTYGTIYSHRISSTSKALTYVVKSEYDIFNTNASFGAEVTVTFSESDSIITSYLNGNQNISINVGDTYADPYPAISVQENLATVTGLATISKEIKIYNTSTVVSTIDTTQAGKYVIEYTVRYKNYENVLKRYVTVNEVTDNTNNTN